MTGPRPNVRGRARTEMQQTLHCPSLYSSGKALVLNVHPPNSGGGRCYREGQGILKGRETRVDAILNKVVREGLPDKETFEQRPERSDRVNPMANWENKLLGALAPLRSTVTI